MLAILLKPRSQQQAILTAQVKNLIDYNEGGFLFYLFWLGHNVLLGLADSGEFVPVADAEQLAV